MNQSKALRLLVLISILSLVDARSVFAATFTVDSTSDMTDTTPGDGICDDGTGSCTLRAAIEEANAFVGDNTINIPAGIYTLTLGSELTINSDITLNGAGMGTTIVQAAEAPGAAAFRVFNVVADTNVVVTDMTVRHGVTPLGYGGSGILIQDGTVTLERIEVVANTSTDHGAISVWSGTLTLLSGNVHGNDGISGQAGGIFNYPNGTIKLQQSAVTGNSAGFGGGIANFSGTFTFLDCTIADNTAVYGGGIGNANGGSVELVNSAVLRNTSSNDGGGILNQGPLTVVDSIIADNETDSVGGGVYNQEGLFTLTRSTISGNTGGGIWNLGRGTVIATNSTVSSNSSISTGGINNFRGITTLINSTVVGNASTLGYGPGGIRNDGGTLSLSSTILASNSSPDSPDCSGDITSFGYNIVGNVYNCGFSPSTGDSLNVDPMLGPLADNGGPTETHALLPGSPAIDTGHPNCPPPATDQRGVARPQGEACDIGSYEAETASIDVEIDIKPGSFPNATNVGSRGKIPVAILTTAGFDASTVDVGTIQFGPSDAQPVHYTLEDVEGDTDWDLILHFKTQETGIACGDTEAMITGQTLDAVPIAGTDSIKTVGCKN